MKKQYSLKGKKSFIFFLLLISAMFIAVLVIVPFNGAPDESMRYDIAYYIYKHGELPRGDDPEIINKTWGISYGFTPINSYIFSAFLMKTFSFLGGAEENLLYVARMISVLFSIGTVIFCMRIAWKLFEGIYRWLFVILVSLLPEFIYISGYVNCDSMALFTVAWIIYALLLGKEQKWSLKNCIFLGGGIGLCLLSYYNAYGVILIAVIYSIASVLQDKEINNKGKFIFIRFMWVFLVSFAIAGWWFVRNAILYNGDILGLSASSQCGEKNAIEAYKPSNRETPYKLGYSLKYMLFDMGWIELSKNSFVAAFGYMQYFLEQWYYNLYYYIVGFGIVGCLIGSVFSRIVKKKSVVEKEERNTLFWLCMAGVCVITIGISIYYSYFNDYQPQGRYCMPMLISLALLLTKGISNIGLYFHDYIGKTCAYLICLYMFFVALTAMSCSIMMVY